MRDKKIDKLLAPGTSTRIKRCFAAQQQPGAQASGKHGGPRPRYAIDRGSGPRSIERLDESRGTIVRQQPQASAIAGEADAFALRRDQMLRVGELDAIDAGRSEPLGAPNQARQVEDNMRAQLKGPDLGRSTNKSSYMGQCSRLRSAGASGVRMPSGRQAFLPKPSLSAKSAADQESRTARSLMKGSATGSHFNHGINGLRRP
jgi:hypothetical protein